MSHFALTAVGSDRPGIVAAVAEALFKLGCNVEDSQMSILRGHFAMMLIVAAPEGVGERELEAELEPVRGRLELEALVVRKVLDLHSEAAAPSHILTVYGADHPGIVALVSSTLAERSVNITDLNTRLVGEPDAPLYAMLMEIALPPELPVEQLEAALEEVGEKAQVELSLRPLEAEAL